MSNLKTRCLQCVYAENKVTQEPCNKCNEIQYKQLCPENHFKASNSDEKEIE